MDRRHHGKFEGSDLIRHVTLGPYILEAHSEAFYFAATATTQYHYGIVGFLK